MRIYLALFFLMLIKAVTAQDIGIVDITSPVTGCVLTTAEDVKVVIFNFGPNINTNIDVSYKINGGAPVNETIVITPPFLSGSSYTYTFAAKANLFTAGTYTLEAYTSYPGDTDPSNDAFVNYIVDSYPFSVGGAILSNTTVCSGLNSGTLTLTGYTGSVLNWEFSTNEGSSWNNIINTSATQNYTNISTLTYYRSQIKSGTCASVYSGTVSVSVDSSSIGGAVSPDVTLCSGSNIGNLTLSGYRGTILNWEYSTDGGANWNTIINTSATENYNNITSTRLYRSIVKNGTCPSVNSLLATAQVDPASIGGTVGPNATVCSGLNNGTLNLTGNTGNILNWEFSINSGGSWTSIPNTTSTQNYSNLTSTTWYRTTVKNSVCTSTVSATAIVNISSPSVGGTVNSNTTVCYGSGGSVMLSGNTGKVTGWESSIDNGNSWTTIADTTLNLNYTNITSVTLFRAEVKNETCPSAFSASATVSIFPSIVNAGNDASIKYGSSVTLNASGGINYTWLPTTGLNNPGIANPVANPTTTTTYSLYVIDLNNCNDSDYVDVSVSPADFNFLISNLITLNNDGINDTWYIENIDQYPLSQVSIFNINGQEIFSAAPYNNDWDGTYKGKKVPDGTYYYILKFMDTGKTYKGNITIVSEKN